MSSRLERGHGVVTFAQDLGGANSADAALAAVSVRFGVLTSSAGSVKRLASPPRSDGNLNVLNKGVTELGDEAWLQ